MADRHRRGRAGRRAGRRRGDRPRLRPDAVYDAAVALDGAGNWLAINTLADGAPQTPYALPDAKPLTYEELLTRKDSDPLFVDVAAYTDYYRLRASVTAQADVPDGVVRYDWPAPHASAAAGPLVFAAANPDGSGGFGCNGGVPVPLNPIGYGPYVRTLVVALSEVVAGGGDLGDLPEPARFDLETAPASSPETFNGLDGVALAVPAVDEDTLQPKGGVRYPEAVAPLGRPTPVSIPPVAFTGIRVICGNFGGWQPFSAAELAQRYGGVDGYLAEYSAALDDQVEAGYVAENERAGMLAAARAAYTAAA